MGRELPLRDPLSGGSDQALEAWPVRNRPRTTARVCFLLALLCLLGVVDPFREGSPVAGAWALTFLSVLATFSLLAMALIFRSRSRKLARLGDGVGRLAAWQLTDEEKETYVLHLFAQEKHKNKLLFFLVLALMSLVFGLFLLFIDEGRGGMLLIYTGIMAVVALFAWAMPRVHCRQGYKGDGKVLVGKKGLYVNGVFHQWDAPLSGLRRAGVTGQPFYGLEIRYYYTERTLRKEVYRLIPLGRTVDVQNLLTQLNAQ